MTTDNTGDGVWPKSTDFYCASASLPLSFVYLCIDSNTVPVPFPYLQFCTVSVNIHSLIILMVFTYYWSQYPRIQVWVLQSLKRVMSNQFYFCTQPKKTFHISVACFL